MYDIHVCMHTCVVASYIYTRILICTNTNISHFTLQFMHHLLQLIMSAHKMLTKVMCLCVFTIKLKISIVLL